MSENPRNVTEAMLHAYVDGVLEEGLRERVESYLDAHPAEMERIRAYQQQNEVMRAFARGMLEEPLPGRLRRGGRGRGLMLRVAAAAALLLVGGLGGWSLNALTGAFRPAPALYHQAAVAHTVFTPEVRHPVEVGADEEQHLYAWLSKRLDTKLVSVNLEAAGYRLVGGRLLAGESGPAAQFMFENGHGARLTLYVRGGGRPSRRTAFRFDRRGGVNVVYWISGPVGYALSGELDKPELMAVAELVHRQLDGA